MSENPFTKAESLNAAAEKLWKQEGGYLYARDYVGVEHPVGIEFDASFDDWQKALAEAGYRLVEIEAGES